MKAISNINWVGNSVVTMDFKTQTNHQPQAQPAPQSRLASAPNGGSNNSRAIVALAVGLVVVIALAVGALLLWKGAGSTSGATGDSAVDKGRYQAVFMTNGQVYFGHLSKLGGDYAQMTDIYYLQVQQSVQPAATDKKSSTDQPQVSLTKLGKELHGPDDEMHISKDQILFWENLKDDSTVVKAIKDYKNKQ